MSNGCLYESILFVETFETSLHLVCHRVCTQWRWSNAKEIFVATLPFIYIYIYTVMEVLIMWRMYVYVCSSFHLSKCKMQWILWNCAYNIMCGKIVVPPLTKLPEIVGNWVDAQVCICIYIYVFTGLLSLSVRLWKLHLFQSP